MADDEAGAVRADPSGRDYHRGDIYIADLGPYTGSEQGGVRPVVILQNNKGNHYSPTLIVAPVTSSARKSKTLPVHYFVRRAKGLNRKSVVLLEQVTTIDKGRIKKYLGRMSGAQMKEIGEVLKLSLGLRLGP